MIEQPTCHHHEDQASLKRWLSDEDQPTCQPGTPSTSPLGSWCGFLSDQADQPDGDYSARLTSTVGRLMVMEMTMMMLVILVLMITGTLRGLSLISYWLHLHHSTGVTPFLVGSSIMIRVGLISHETCSILGQGCRQISRVHQHPRQAPPHQS